MKKIFLLIISLVFSFQVKAVDFFQGTYKEALLKAKEENKLVLLYFTASWCGPCHYMNQNIFTEKSIDLKISANYVFLKLDIDNPSTGIIYEKYNSDKRKSVPRFFFINYKEEIIKKHLGGATISAFKNFIDIPEYSKPIGKALADSILNKKKPSNYKKASAFDRFIWNSFHSKWKLGIKAGVNFNKLHISSPYNNYDSFKTGYNFGIFAERATKHFMIEPGIAFYRKGGKDKSSDTSLKLSYLEVPVKLSVNLFKQNIISCPQPVRLNVEPYAAFALSGKVETDLGTEKVNFGSGRNELNRFDYGVKVGVSFQLGSFEPSFGYDFGLNNLSNNPNFKSYNRGFYFNMALLFGR